MGEGVPIPRGTWRRRWPMGESIRFLWPYLRRHWRALALGFGALILKDLLGVMAPLAIRRGVDSLKGGGGWNPAVANG